MAKQIGELEIWYRDYNEDEFNDSVDCTFSIWGKDGDSMSIEEYYYLCKRFAATMGFAEKTINQWFGDL